MWEKHSSGHQNKMEVIIVYVGSLMDVFSLSAYDTVQLKVSQYTNQQGRIIPLYKGAVS